MSLSRSFREFEAPPQFASVVDRVWTREPSPHECGEFDVLPDGAVDLLATVHPDGSLGTPFVVGAMTRPERMRAPVTAFIGIRFLPGAAGAVLGVPQHELTDQQADVGQLFGTCSARTLSDALHGLLQSTRDSGSLDGAALAAVLSRLTPAPRPVPNELGMALATIVRASGTMRVASLATSLRITRQHLARMFATHVGLSPKLFAEICRVRALLSVSAQRPRPWSDLAAQFGYSDQSHLIAAVHRITGRTPKSWQSTPNSISPIPLAADR